jgi:hypothetical protein
MTVTAPTKLIMNMCGAIKFPKLLATMDCMACHFTALHSCTSYLPFWSKTLGNKLFLHSAAAYQSRHHHSQIFEPFQILKGPVQYSGNYFNASLIFCAPP